MAGDLKKKALIICSVLLVIFGAAILVLAFIPRGLKWNEENENCYAARINKNKNVYITQSDKDLLNSHDYFFDSQQERLSYDGFRVEISDVNENEAKNICKYIKSFNKQTGLSGCFALFAVEKDKNFMNQVIYIFDIHEGNIKYSGCCIKARKSLQN